MANKLDQLRKEVEKEERMARESRESSALNRKLKKLKFRKQYPKLTKTGNLLEKLGGSVVRGGAALAKKIDQKEKEFEKKRKPFRPVNSDVQSSMKADFMVGKKKKKKPMNLSGFGDLNAGFLD